MRRFNPEKELRKIQHGNKNKIVLFVVLLLIVSIISYSFALYQVRYSKRIIYTKVAPFSNKDIILTVLVDGKEENDFPSDIGNVYLFDKIECENPTITTAVWDKTQNGLSLLTKGPNKCNIYFIYGKEFEYTGGIQNYTIPKDGTYKLEVWGAQGGYNGGYGGYSVGEIKLTKGTVLYVAVGGAGVTAGAGGYNGGGTGGKNSNTTWGSGGGATHIATETGILSTFSAKRDKILIVAAGGGGGGSGGDYGRSYMGGHAGGYVGVNGNGDCPGYGGSQTAGGGGCAKYGTDYKSSSFGQGATLIGSGGGGGYFGGGGGWEQASSGAGGSSYISTILSNAKMYCYGCTASSVASTLTISVKAVSASPVANSAKTGAGYARITYLGN